MSVFLTGFPGFLGESLVERLVARGRSVTCLVQPHLQDVAERRRDAILAGSGEDAGWLTLVRGDLTEPDLGLDAYEGIADETTELFHLAAVYDLGVDRETAWAVNVRGTERVLDLAAAAAVDRFQYVSTCYVSGRHDGTWTAADLEDPGPFNNHYEASKHAAEVAVRERADDGLPTTIYRPSIVTGDSETGETRKYDGLYYLLRLIQRQPSVALAPVSLRPHAAELNVVPRDYVVAAIDHLAAREDTAGGVYQLCDPDPPTVGELVHLLGAATDRRVLSVPVPPATVRSLLQRLQPLAEALDVEPMAMDYLDHPTTYDDATTRDALAGTDIDPPSLGAYVHRLADFAAAHPALGDAAMT